MQGLWSDVIGVYCILIAIVRSRFYLWVILPVEGLFFQNQIFFFVVILLNYYFYKETASARCEYKCEPQEKERKIER